MAVYNLVDLYGFMSFIPNNTSIFNNMMAFGNLQF